MTIPQAEEIQVAGATLDEESVADYLAAHPEFFERHPDLVAKLRVPHVSAGAVSLIEHQVAVLRGQLETERRRLAHLIARARDFENLSARLHGLTLQLVAAPDLERVETALHEGLCQELNAEVVRLKLFPIGAGARDADPLVGAFLDFLDRDHSLCGPLDPERGGALFGDRAESLASAALIPIKGERVSGVLALGSSDPERFRSDMGTEFLDRLGEVVSRKLGAVQRSHE